MWQDLFRRSYLITRFVQGPWGPYLDEFFTFLHQQQYKPATIRQAIVAAHHFANWLLTQQLSLSDASAAQVVQYRLSLGRCPSACWPYCSEGVSLALCFLEYKKIALPHRALSSDTPLARWLAWFDQHLEHVAGAAASTRRQYHLPVARFLQERFGENEPDWS